jgi:hypothetical protein
MLIYVLHVAVVTCSEQKKEALLRHVCDCDYIRECSLSLYLARGEWVSVRGLQ